MKKMSAADAIIATHEDNKKSAQSFFKWVFIITLGIPILGFICGVLWYVFLFIFLNSR